MAWETAGHAIGACERLTVEEKIMGNEARFPLNFASHIGLDAFDNGMFKHLAGDDPADQVQFAADQGFRAIEDNGFQLRPEEEQDRIADTLLRNGMEMGCMVNTLVWDRPTYNLGETERERILEEVKTTAEAAKKVNGKWLTTLAGFNEPALPRAIQIGNVIENLRFAADVAEREGVTLLLEAVSATGTPGWPGHLLTNILDAHMIVRAVNHPNVRLLFDVYQAQVANGNLMITLDRCWDEIGLFQIADCPGRTELGSGEINYNNFLKEIHRRGYDGIVELEHWNTNHTAEGEERVLEICDEISAYIRS